MRQVLVRTEFGGEQRPFAQPGPGGERAEVHPATQQSFVNALGTLGSPDIATCSIAQFLHRPNWEAVGSA
ncbi:MAG: hypothetical protein R2810_04655 [Flavobacteriales bacterium]